MHLIIIDPEHSTIFLSRLPASYIYELGGDINTVFIKDCLSFDPNFIGPRYHVKLNKNIFPASGVSLVL